MVINYTKSVTFILRASTSMPYTVASNAILGMLKTGTCYGHIQGVVG
jgi:hypothetical protein